MQAMKSYGVVLLLLLIHSHLSLHKLSTATTRTFYSDKQALLAFKNNLDNGSPVLSSWNLSTPYCKWEGIQCCHRNPKRVCALELSSRGLVGSISPHIGNISCLRIIDLRYNELYGIIPSSIGLLHRLQHLRLGMNSLSGTFPANLYNCSKLVNLSLSYNYFSGKLPSWLGNFKKLELLSLGVNNFTGTIPLSIANLSSLQQIYLDNNNLSGSIPSGFGKLCPYYFSFACNELEAKYTADWNFMNFLTNCTRLKELELRQNKLGGRIPSAIANLTSQIHYLDLGQNFIFGEIPSGIGNLIGLSMLFLNVNYLTGSIPIEIGMLRNLEGLYLWNNKFSGSIPTSFGNLTKVTVIWAGNNHLTGSIPSSLGKLTQMTTLELENNSLTGTIPKSLFNIQTLSSGLYLSDNFLSGTIPTEVGMLINLEQLHLSRNNLSGELPEELGNCQVLTILALDSNSFQGTIPSFLSNLNGLEFINLSCNNFSGVIPQELGLLNELQELYLAKNILSGHIPLVIENLTNLYMFDISYNDIEGSVPEKGVFSNVSGLKLEGNNKLCGGIPELHLLKCHNRKHSSLLLKLVVPIISTIFFLALLLLVFLILVWRRKLTREFTTNLLPSDSLPKVTYRQLAQATESFATSNLIGAGKYSHVYKGVLLSNGEGSSNQKSNTVAVKVFDLQQLGSSKGFMVECEALKLIRHRNLIRIRTCCSTFDYNGNDFKALVFDYMPNGNLHRWLHPEIDELKSLRPLSLTQRLSIVIDIADALDYLHHNCYPSVIHCDLKPSNILLGEDFSACVGDFGLAKLLPDPVSKSLVESESSIGIRGSIGYVPPEYGDGGPVSTAGDAYSFGVLLLEIFTGKNPTELMFKDGLTLHNFVEMAFPEQVMDIVDPNLIALDVMENISFKKMREFLVSIIEVGLTCSKQWPIDRMSMEDAATQLHRIKDICLPNINC